MVAGDVKTVEDGVKLLREIESGTRALPSAR